MIRVLAIDDEPLALKQLCAYIGKVPFLELVGACQSALEARKKLNEEAVDAMFIDINMPDLSGMEFVKSLAAPPLVIFTTAYSEYAVEGFKVDAVDYLLKPFDLDEFRRAANRLRERLPGSAAPLPSPAAAAEPVAPGTGRSATMGSHESIFVKTDYRVVKIAIDDIRYIEGMSEYLKLHLDTQPKPIVTLLAMKKLEELLPPNFMRIHRSYMVNLDKIQEVNKNRIIMDEDTYLPIGDNYREAFNKYLNERMLGR